VATAAGDRTMRRRGTRRQQWPATPVDIGTALREAREGSAVTLAEVHDRTGVPWQQLEALESGDLSRFQDQRTALTAVQRYTDLMNLDSPQFARVVQEHWGSPLAGFPSPTPTPSGRGRKSAARSRSESPPPPPPTTGHLSRYPGDESHLRAFTQTAQVPGVTRGGTPAENGFASHGQFSVTGVFPAMPAVHRPVRPAPAPLRAAVWCTVVLLLVGVGGLAVHRYHPQWLADIHLVRGAHHGTSTSGGAGSRPSSTRSSVVTQTSITNAGASISVRAAQFSVEVAASQPCWVSASTPQSFSPIFGKTLQAGDTALIDSANGQLTVNVGSSFVLMVVKINGKTAPGWLFKPPNAPFVLNFTSATASGSTS